MRQRDDLVFSMEEFARRIAELRRRMEVAGVEVMLTTTPENICYLTGFESPGHYWFQGLIVPLEGEPIALMRRLERLGYEVLTWLEHIESYEDGQDPMVRLHDCLEQAGWSGKRIGYEKDCWFFTALQQEHLFAKCPNAHFVDCSGLVEEGRLIKSEAELVLMRQAAQAAEAGMEAGVEAIHEGVCEDDVAAAMQYAMTKAGSHWPAIAPFVASGERGAIGHATWMGRKIQRGDSIFLEIGGCRYRYHAAILRTVVVGEVDHDTQTAFEVVQEAFEATVATIRSGVSAETVDAVARSIIAKSSFGGTQASRTAYSIGIGLPPDWGEGQILSMKPGEERPLQTNMTFHLLPWVQIPGKGGIGCSETIRVTEHGCERLTHYPRALLVCA